MIDLPTATHRRFATPRSVYEYGFDKDGPIKQPGSPSDYLLSWDAIDAHTRSFVDGRPCQLIVIGEYVREDGLRFPDLVMNPAWMESIGYRGKGQP
jgi:hypothetical protein